MKKRITSLARKWPVYLLLLIIAAACSPQKDKSKVLNLPDPLEAGWQGDSVCEVVKDNDNIRVLKCTFPPGVGHERHYHDPHVGYTLAGGTFKITDEEGTREMEVPTGFSFSNDEITVHEVLNVGKDTAQFLIIEYK